MTTNKNDLQKRLNDCYDLITIISGYDMEEEEKQQRIETVYKSIEIILKQMEV
jgi:hypothetical protein